MNIIKGTYVTKSDDSTGQTWEGVVTQVNKDIAIVVWTGYVENTHTVSLLQPVSVERQAILKKDEIQSYIHHVDIYLDIALPKAREEDAKGNLDLECWVTACGTKGCLLFHYANAIGVDPLYVDNGDDSYYDYDDIYRVMSTLGVTTLYEHGGVFDADSSLDQREAGMRKYREQLVSELESL